MIATIKLVWPEEDEGSLQSTLSANPNALWRTDTFPNLVTYRRMVKALNSACVKRDDRDESTGLLAELLKDDQGVGLSDGMIRSDELTKRNGDPLSPTQLTMASCSFVEEPVSDVSENQNFQDSSSVRTLPINKSTGSIHVNETVGRTDHDSIGSEHLRQRYASSCHVEGREAEEGGRTGRTSLVDHSISKPGVSGSIKDDSHRSTGSSKTLRNEVSTRLPIDVETDEATDTNDILEKSENSKMKMEIKKGMPPKMFKEVITPECQIKDIMKRYRVNDSQAKAILAATSNTLSLIQGPPGTGKTHTAGIIIQEWLKDTKHPVSFSVSNSKVHLEISV